MWRDYTHNTEQQFNSLVEKLFKLFKFCIPGEVKITTALISMSQANLKDSGTCGQMASSCKSLIGQFKRNSIMHLNHQIRSGYSFKM